MVAREVMERFAKPWRRNASIGSIPIPSVFGSGPVGRGSSLENCRVEMPRRFDSYRFRK